MIVMKFGGTSVRDREAMARLIGVVRREHGRTRSDRGSDRAGPVVVVSALAGVTDRLFEVASLARDGRADEAERVLDELRVRHLEMVGLVRDGERRHVLLGAVDANLGELTSLVQAVGVLGELSSRSQDAMAAVGELMSSRIVAAALAEAGLEAAWVDARDVLVTTDDHSGAQPLFDETGDRLEQRVRPLLAQGAVPVVGGYVGATASGVTTTLGRGGSDYSAAIVGACLGAGEIQIWTDVDGMLTADPRVVPHSRVVAELSFDEASELAYFGAKVLHPSTILPAVARGIPVRIRNSYHPGAMGTRIDGNVAPDRGPLAAIACKRGVTRIDITSTRMLMAYGFLRRAFEVFERFRTPVDVVTTSEVSVSVTIDDRRRLDQIIDALSAFAQVTCEADRAIVCAVGEGLRDDPALGARAVGTLQGLPLEMVSQGGSRKNVTVVVPDAAVAETMRRLHDHFFGAAADAPCASAAAHGPAGEAMPS